MLARAGKPHLNSFQRVLDPNPDASGGKVKAAYAKEAAVLSVCGQVMPGRQY